LVFQFAGVDSISAAEPLEGAEVTIPFEERAPLEEGEYYQSDLIGCAVIDAKTGRNLGEIEDWQEYGGPLLLVVKTPEHKELLIPFAKSICREIDLASRRVIADLPEGLADL
jgi:16S rRNA processing protein RimM